MRDSRKALLALGLCCVVSCSEPEEVRRLSGVLITVDTTNPGALDIYGKDRGITPRILALASESLVFDQALTVAPLALPSHAPILTGLMPLRHGVRDNGLWALPDGAETLAERAAGAGFQTAAFVSAAVLSGIYGLDQGFEVYDEPQGSAFGLHQGELERSASEVTRAAQAWIKNRDPSIRFSSGCTTSIPTPRTNPSPIFWPKPAATLTWARWRKWMRRLATCSTCWQGRWGSTIW